MSSSNHPLPSDAPPDVSLVRGGPFYRIQQALGLIRPGHWNIGRRIVVLVAIGWLPLVLITAISNPAGLHSLLTEYRIYARMLIAVPALLFGEIFMESRVRAVLIHLRRSGLMDPPDLAYIDGVVARLARIRNAILPEIAVLLFLIVHTITVYKSLIDSTPWLGQGTGVNFQLTHAGWYAVVVSAPVPVPPRLGSVELAIVDLSRL